MNRNGRYIVEVPELRNIIKDHFQKQFTGQDWERPSLQNLDFKKINDSDNEFLAAPFTEDEVKEAVWDCNKSPGPDRVTFFFLKDFCDTIKSEVIDFIQQFHRNGKLV